MNQILLNLGRSKRELVSMKNIDESVEIVKNETMLGINSEMYKI